MLRIRTLGASALTLALGSFAATAADVPVYEAPPPAVTYAPTPAFSWSGPYLGLTGGYGWGSGTGSPKGWLGGGYAGYNFQTNSNLVLGVEGDFTFTGKSGASGGSTISNPWNATVRGRVGYAWDRFLVYGTGGVAFGQVKAVTAGTTESTNKAGWTAGVGVEAALTENVVGRLEYRHTNLGTTTFGVAGPVSSSSNDIMVGVGFKF
jgi:outer membrane immunogenic protein